jgi:hypothetical protein
VDQDWAEEKRPASEPEQRLLMAIVRRAVWDFVLYRALDADDSREDAKRLAWAEAAAEWLFWDGVETSDEEGRYTFMYICEVLGIEPAHFREQVMKLTREDIQRLNNKIKMDERHGRIHRRGDPSRC